MTALDLFRLEGRIAFISGTAGHLGREMAPALGEAGAHLLLNGRNDARLQAFASKLTTRGIRAVCAAFDMIDFPAVRRFFAGRPFIAVTMTPKSFESAAPGDFDQTCSSVTAAFEATRAAQPALARAARLRHRDGAGSGRRLDRLVVV